MGYPTEGRWHRSPLELVSTYMDQFPENDLSRARSREFGFPIYPTIAEALRCGGDKLDVDGVLLVGEHGKYPVNELGQTLYPRYEFFKEIVEVFKQDGRTVPVFNDKHLSWKWEWSKEMVDTAHAMGFPLLAGSSLPVTWRMPSIDLPYGAEVGGSHVRGHRRGGQLRFPRPGDHPVHGGTPPGRRDRSGLAPGNAGGSGLGSHGEGLFRRRRLGPATLHHLPLPKSDPHPGGNHESPLPHPGSRFSNGSRSRWSTVSNTPTD